MPTPGESRQVAGRYRLNEVLGRGAMGTVWAAYDEVLGRPVAVKEVLLPPGIPAAEADTLRERTLREARAIAVLSHPNVVTLYDVAREGPNPFVVMELVSSRSLAEVLRDDGPLPMRQAATVGTAVAAALAAAHAAGITHRDVKPGNVLVAHDGRVKLTDFGIARNRADSTLTASGLMLGSPAFMAPEVASGCPVTSAADLWGLGATLFAAIEGHPPYDVAGDPVATVSAVVHGDIPVPAADGPVAAVIRGLMVKDPAARMPLHEVHRRLRPLADDRTRAPFPTGAHAPILSPRPVPPPPPSRAVAPLAAQPGPLPWQASAAVPRRDRSVAVPVVRYGLAVVLLVASAAATFAVTRTAVGLPVLPSAAAPAPSASTPTASTTTAGPPPLTGRRVPIAALDGSDPVAFALALPVSWPEFRERRTVAGVPSEVVRFVSPDGTAVIAVERIAGFDGEPSDYLDAYLAAIEESVTRLLPVGQTTIGSEVELTYRTVEGSGDQALLCTTFLRLLPLGSDLWALQVTVPTEREEAGRTELFDRILPTFIPLA